MEAYLWVTLGLHVLGFLFTCLGAQKSLDIGRDIFTAVCCFSLAVWSGILLYNI